MRWNEQHRGRLQGTSLTAPPIDARVLLVDDDPFTLELLGDLLKGAGFRNITDVSQPQQALETIRATLPDVVLLDLVMPGLSGFDILDAINAEADLRYIPVIILTASSDPASKLRALELGATDFLAKPVDPSELTLRLRNTLAFKAYRDRLAFFDNLTDLPNRRAFITRVQSAVAQAAEVPTRFAVLHLGLDRFMRINNALGYSVGDALLKAVARRIRDALHACETAPPAEAHELPVLSRFGGDEFTILLPNSATQPACEALARHLLEALAKPFWIDSRELFVTASMGIALCSHGNPEAATLLRHADTALRVAKQRGRNRFEFHSAELNALAAERLILSNELHRAIERDELRLHYQPQIDIASGKIVSVEALLRWHNPQFGMVMPDRFIHLAEESGMIVHFGAWSLHEACRQTTQWDEAGFRPLSVSVNVAAAQLQQQFLEVLDHALASSGLTPERLTLELTESMLMAGGEQVFDLIDQIAARGIKLSIDDFGTLYSTFSYIKRLPLDEIKIDRAFVRDMLSCRKSAAIVASMLTLADALALKVVAEGIESLDQCTHLALRQCQFYQGYFFSRPLPPSELDVLLAKDAVFAATAPEGPPATVALGCLLDGASP